MKIELEVSEENEATRSPWWVIINPSQNLRTDEQGIYAIASMITGPFFSREEAENTLKRTRYNYNKYAKVFCMSGCYTVQYAEKVKF